MGRAIEEMCGTSEKFTIVGGVDINLGIPHEFPVVSDINELTCNADAIIDFSHHSAAKVLCSYAVKTSTPVIFCTTGYTEEELATIRKASENVAVFRSGNMSLGINLLIELSKKAAEILEGFDIDFSLQFHIGSSISRFCDFFFKCITIIFWHYYNYFYCIRINRI